MCVSVCLRINADVSHIFRIFGYFEQVKSPTSPFSRISNVLVVLAVNDLAVNDRHCSQSAVLTRGSHEAHVKSSRSREKPRILVCV